MKFWIGFVALCLFATGCGDRLPKLEIAPVSGVATLGGKPLENYRIYMYVADNDVQEPATARIDSEGKFTMSTRSPGDGAAVGKNKVFFRYDPPAPEGVDGPWTPPPPKVSLPAKYTEADSSGIEIDVTRSGLTDHKIEL